MKLAFLFPGQGAQKVGMGQALAAAHAEARAAFETADRVLGFPLARLCWEGPLAELTESKNAQPALLTHSVAALRLVRAAGLKPQWTAGHSLGEYSACVAAGALDFEDALRLTRRRGELMTRAGRERPGTMAAILGLPGEAVEAICRDASVGGVVVAANLNAPGQVVVSGEPEAVERACVLANERGARRAIRLEVSGAFHSPLMAAAADELAAAIESAPIRDAECPILPNVRAEPVVSAAEIRAALTAQLLGAVRWEDTMRRLLAEGAAFLELGTGTVLRGLLRSADKQARSWNVEDPDSLQSALAGLGVPAGSTEGA
jgi:[acyl-carrier-protein] S-malonyltransferase